MSSSFRRASGDSNARSLTQTYSGLKPWINTGLGIISSGNKQLDDIMGGGFALGTLILLESDSYSTYGEDLLRYGVAEGVSHGHACLCISGVVAEALKVYDHLPYNQTISSANRSSANSRDIKTSFAAKGDEEGGNKSTSHPELTIAWQYGKYLNQGKLWS